MWNSLRGPWPTQTDSRQLQLPWIDLHVPAGFPSPAGDWAEDQVDFNQRFIPHPYNTFFFQVAGDSMEGPEAERSVPNGAILIVDRAITPEHDDVVVAAIDGNFTVKRLICQQGQLALKPENPAYPLITLNPEQTLDIWGVVLGCYKEFKPHVRTGRR